MKKFFIGLIIVIISLAITFATFETLSWYHLGDIPTEVVLFRLIGFFMIINIVLVTVLLLLKKEKRKYSNKK